MKRRNQILIFLLSTLFLFFTLCGCAENGKAVSETQMSEPFLESPQYEWGTVSGRTLTVWGRETDLSRTYIQKAFARYEELTHNKIQAVSMTPEELDMAGAAAFQSGEGAPDLILSYGGVNIDAFDPDENFYDFSDAVWVDDLTDVSINQTIYHGKVIGLPHWEASVSGTIYNKEIFEKLDIKLPQTQEEFQKICETLLENGVTPLYLPCADPTMMLYQFPLDCLVEEKKTLVALNHGTTSYAQMEGMRTIVEWYRNMAKSGYLGEKYMENDWSKMSLAMSSGDYAMMLCWDTWLYTDFKGDASKFGLMPAYVGVPEEGTFEGPNLALFLVNRKGEQVDAALDFVTFLADPYNYNVAFAQIYTAPVFKRQIASISTPQYTEMEKWIEKKYRDSVAWLRIRGFSQSDAGCILKYMQGEENYSMDQCLDEMDALRLERITDNQEK